VSLEQFQDVFISDGLSKREADAVWRAQCHDRPVLLYFAWEFQSNPVWHMAFRAATIRQLIYRRLIEREGLPVGKMPLVVVIVVYTGKARWTAASDVGNLIEEHEGLEAMHPRGSTYLLLDLHRLSSEVLATDHPASILFEMETCRKPENLASGLRRLVGMLNEDHPLRNLFKRWVRLVLMPRWLPGAEMPDMDGLEEFLTMMEQEMPEWTRQNMAKGETKGETRGTINVLTTQIQAKFGTPPDAVRERVESASTEQALEWARRILFAKTLDEVFS
jgi:hypothetical protein